MSDKKTIHFFNDVVLPGKYHNATKFARINLANAFSEQDNIEQVNFYFLTDSEKNLSRIDKLFNEKIKLKPIVIPWVGDLSFEGGQGSWKEAINRAYRILLSNRVVSIYFFVLLWKVSKKNETIFIRGEKVLQACFFVGLLKKINYALELHNYEFGKSFLKDKVHKRIMKKAVCIVSITDYTKGNWVEEGIDKDKILVLPSGVNIKSFDDVSDDKESLRRELGLDIKAKIATYLGGLYKNRGIEEIIHAASRNPDIKFLIIGGTDKEVENFTHKKEGKYQNIAFLGFIDHEKIPKYLKASDVLLAPYSKKVKTINHMSPVKLFEYMAAKVPVIASDLPRIREIASDDEMLFFESDDGNSLDAKIKDVFANEGNARQKARNAYAKVAEYSWKRRGKRILEKIKK